MIPKKQIINLNDVISSQLLTEHSVSAQNLEFHSHCVTLLFFTIARWHLEIVLCTQQEKSCIERSYLVFKIAMVSKRTRAKNVLSSMPLCGIRTKGFCHEFVAEILGNLLNRNTRGNTCTELKCLPRCCSLHTRFLSF